MAKRYCSLRSQQLGQNAFHITFGDGILPRMSRDFAIIHGKTPRGILPVNSYDKTPDGISSEQLLNFYNIGLIIRILIYDLSQTLQNLIIKICIFFSLAGSYKDIGNIILLNQHLNFGGIC